ncbi:hypothetical protein LguiA_023940 [Lonicera macranthoides]
MFSPPPLICTCISLSPFDSSSSLFFCRSLTPLTFPSTITSFSTSSLISSIFLSDYLYIDIPKSSQLKLNQTYQR